MKKHLSALLPLWSFLLLASPATARIEASQLPGSHQQIEKSWRDRWQQDGNAHRPYVNRLVLSQSAYLKQHADNPIDWYPWADEAFARAITENKLIFLSIGYASCHWCHVMEEESFADTEVATLLNSLFVSIKVDREQKPDVDAYYNLVVETIKGESGWPVTLVLLPDLSPVLAANYLDKKSLLTAIGRLGKIWQEQPAILEQSAGMLSAEVEKRSRVRRSISVSGDEQWAARARQQLLADIDLTHGGFGAGNKFPDELKLQFLLNQYKQEQTEDLRDELITQLDAVMNGGLNDVVYGGVFRYTTDRQMSRPHFEKMLYNQALIVYLFTDAADWLGKPEYAAFATAVISFAKNTLRLPNGTYAAAVDADHEGREGGYYLWPEDVLVELPTDIQKVSFGEGLFFVYGPSATSQGAPWQQRLKDSRASEPRVVENQITAWNALWLTALTRAGDIEEAESLAKGIWDSSWSMGRLYRLGSQPAFLDDYGYLSNAFWQLHMKTGSRLWKERARILDRMMLDQFYIDGELSYRSRDMRGQYPVDLYQDKELPSPIAVVLWSFARHQTELEFVEAYETLNAGANTVIGHRPEYYLSLVQAGENAPEASEHIIARGHGLISLKAGKVAGDWLVTIGLDDEWHVNASVVLDKNLVPTQVSGEGVTGVDYPDGAHLKTDFSDEVLNVYSGQVEIGVSLPVNQLHARLSVKLQACSTNVCLLPELVHLISSPSANSDKYRPD